MKFIVLLASKTLQFHNVSSISYLLLMGNLTQDVVVLFGTSAVADVVKIYAVVIVFVRVAQKHVAMKLACVDVV